MNRTGSVNEPLRERGGGIACKRLQLRDALLTALQRVAHRAHGGLAALDSRTLTTGSVQHRVRVLFDAARGYRGPGQGTPVGVWRVPWPERAARRIEAPLPATELAQYRALAAAWDEHAAARGWSRTRFVAYLFDEVDTAQDTGGPRVIEREVRRAHTEIRRVQAALDEGARRHRIR